MGAIAVVGMLRTIYPFCLIMFLLPFDKPPKNKKFVDSLKVFDSTIEKNGLVSTLFSKSLLWIRSVLCWEFWHYVQAVSLFLL